MRGNKGQIGLPIVLTVGALIASAVASVFAITNSARQDTARVSERTTKLETTIDITLPALNNRLDKIETQLSLITDYWKIPQKK